MLGLFTSLGDILLYNILGDCLVSSVSGFASLGELAFITQCLFRLLVLCRINYYSE